ncbi:hypothetical protein SAY87_028963 [Trapa incisa]|uniref:Uncharacterized protein n=1 Tax=Trapa incisa TaxID=236973 RepID=A0AAN7QP89_9MYRT|nr:hypothetical protein SAY87_028963 [Trapa incisa]
MEVEAPGVKAVIAKSFERTHCASSLGEDADTLGLTGHERFTLYLPNCVRDIRPGQDVTLVTDSESSCSVRVCWMNSSTLVLTQMPNIKVCCLSKSLQLSIVQEDYPFEEDHVIGDCVVFEDAIFDDPYLHSKINPASDNLKKKKLNEVKPENLVPDHWREVQAELNISKKDKCKIAQELEFGCRVEKRKQGYAPLRSVSLEEHKAYKEAKLAQLKPVELENPTSFPVKKDQKEESRGDKRESERVVRKNPRMAVYGKGLQDITEFFNSGNYQPGVRSSDGLRQLFTKEEKVLLNKWVPDLATASSDKWLPLHTLAASGEFYLVHALLKHDLDINSVDKNQLSALHKVITSNKQAIMNHLLRESADPLVQDKGGATLIHYAVQTASNQAIKILLLYNVDINLQDNDGWTPLHLAVQTRRTDVVRLLLLIKGADTTIRNQEGLTPLELCLYSGRDSTTYELIKLLKQLPMSR